MSPIKTSQNIPVPNDVNKMDKDGFCPLLRAAKSGDLARATYLIEKEKAMVNICGEYCYTPLHWAAENGDEKLVVYLLSMGASNKKLSSNNRYPSDLAPRYLKELILKSAL